MAKKDELNFENENKIAPSEKLKALQAAMDKIEKINHLIKHIEAFNSVLNNRIVLTV